jgi:energy-coupling factor transporter ATP-binding protein EcfA2
MTVILKDVSFSYFDDDVLRAVNLTLDRGLVHLVIGRTGSGKTTLALLLAGLLRPARGTVRIDDCDPTAGDFERHRVQLAFQFPESQIFEMTVEKELTYGLRNFGFESREIIRRRDWALECVGLSGGMLERDPGNLSFGERRKVALASIIALKPEYLILDEPLAGLDWRGRTNLIATVGKLKDEGLTTIMLTHESDIVNEIGDSVTIAAGQTFMGPFAVDDFLHPEGEPAHDLLPEYILAFREVKGAGLAVGGKPRTVRDTARAIGEALRRSRIR